MNRNCVMSCEDVDKNYEIDKNLRKNRHLQ